MKHATVEVVVPIGDGDDGGNVELLRDHLAQELPFAFAITVVDAGDAGRGKALRAAWLASDADVLACVDADLATNLECVLPLLAPVASGHSELAIGTRLGARSRGRRRLGRELLSRPYNRLVRLLFHAGFSDAQCGLKAIRGDVARRLVPLVEDDGWFFDTELLLRAERAGLRIHEVAVDWSDDLGRPFGVPSMAIADLRGLWRLRRMFTPALGQLARFGVVGAGNTLLSLLVLHVALAVGAESALAAGVAFVAGAVNGYAWNRRWTFAAVGSTATRVRYALVQVGGLALTTALFPLLRDTGIGATAAYLLTTAAVTLTTFLANRAWTFTAGAQALPGAAADRDPMLDA